MTPEEKAIELLSKYYSLSNGMRTEIVWGDLEIVRDNDLKKSNSKKCAIICVEQIINELNEALEITGSSYVREEIKHWNEVLEHLKTS